MSEKDRVIELLMNMQLENLINLKKHIEIMRLAAGEKFWHMKDVEEMQIKAKIICELICEFQEKAKCDCCKKE